MVGSAPLLTKIYFPRLLLPPASLGMSFASGGRTYTIRGLNLKAPRFPVLADRDDGRGFRFPAETVAGLLQQQHPEKWAEMTREK